MCFEGLCQSFDERRFLFFFFFFQDFAFLKPNFGLNIITCIGYIFVGEFVVYLNYEDGSGETTAVTALG